MLPLFRSNRRTDSSLTVLLRFFAAVALVSLLLLVPSCGHGKGGGSAFGNLTDYSGQGKGTGTGPEGGTAAGADSGDRGSADAAGTDYGTDSATGFGSATGSGPFPSSLNAEAPQDQGNTPFNLASGGTAVERGRIIWFTAWRDSNRIYRWDQNTGYCLPLPFDGGEDRVWEGMHHLNLTGDTLWLIHGWENGGYSPIQGILVSMALDGTGIRTDEEHRGLTCLAVSGGYLYAGSEIGLLRVDPAVFEFRLASDIPEVRNLISTENALFFISDDERKAGLYRYEPDTGRTERLPIDDAGLFSFQDGLLIGIKSESEGIFTWDPETGEERLLSARSVRGPAMIAGNEIISWSQNRIVRIALPDEEEEILLPERTSLPQIVEDLIFFRTDSEPPRYGFMARDGSGIIRLEDLLLKPRATPPADPAKADFVLVPGMAYNIFIGIRALSGGDRYLEFRNMDGNAMEEAVHLVPIVSGAAGSLPENVWPGTETGELAQYTTAEQRERFLTYQYLSGIGAAVPRKTGAGPSSSTGLGRDTPQRILIDQPFSCSGDAAIQEAMERARNLTEGLPPEFLVDWKAGRTETGSQQYEVAVLIRYGMEKEQPEGVQTARQQQSPQPLSSHPSQSAPPLGDESSGQWGTVMGSGDYLNGGEYRVRIDYLLDANGTVKGFDFSVTRIPGIREDISLVNRELVRSTEILLRTSVIPVLDDVEKVVRRTFSLFPAEPGRTVSIGYVNGTLFCQSLRPLSGDGGADDDRFSGSYRYLFSESIPSNPDTM